MKREGKHEERRGERASEGCWEMMTYATEWEGGRGGMMSTTTQQTAGWRTESNRKGNAEEKETANQSTAKVTIATRKFREK